jgi:hypothetical protein
VKVQVKRIDNLGKEYSTDTTFKTSTPQPKPQEEEEAATEETKPSILDPMSQCFFGLLSNMNEATSISG